MELAFAFLLIIVLAMLCVWLIPSLLMAPAVGIAAGLWHLGVPAFWAALIGLLVYGTAMGWYLERRERRKTEPKRPGRGGVAGVEAAETARRTRARLASR